MKKALWIVLSCLLSLLFLVSCVSNVYQAAPEVCLFYSDSGIQDGFYIAVNKLADCCFVGCYFCEEYTEGMEITIPDEYGGIPITRIGGWFGRGVPTPFSISLGSSFLNAPADSEYSAVYGGSIENYQFDDPYTVEELVFVLHIGKNIQTVEYVDMDEYYPHINGDGSVTFYHPVVYINCSEENPYFYSRDGLLFDRETDAMIGLFAYASSGEDL